jgi:glutaredoxin
MDIRPYRVYWQPGCTSCLKAKEFLARHGIAYESIDVRAVPGAMEALTALGARSIPVVARGDAWTYAQDLDTLAAFVGVARTDARLGADVLVARLDALLDAVARHARQLPDDALERTLPGRPDRAGADLVYHVACIVDALLDAGTGARLEYERFLLRPAGERRSRAALARRLAGTRIALQRWWSASAGTRPASVDTYYGVQSLHGVLERTAWHVAQHARQLQSLVEQAGLEPDVRLSARELGGLPLPDGLWDREVGEIKGI